MSVWLLKSYFHCTDVLQKINATNSWNFALIDYFHDMSLLREGDGVNFQRASCTLDGCVKIYTNRVDSVATETSKLLSGLADSNSGKQNDEDDQEEGDDDGEDENGSKKRSKKRVSTGTMLYKGSHLINLGSPFVRDHFGDVVCAATTEKDGARICNRSPLQKGLCRL
jgi:Condensin complex subunit 2